jgi:hypothetical protein
VELVHEVGLALEQLGLKQLMEQPVVAIPLAPAIERHQEQVGPVQRFQDPARTRSAHDRIAQRTAHALEHRGAREERHPAARDPGQQLGPQVVGHEAVVTIEGDPLRMAPAAGLEGEGGDVEADRPPLGALHQLGDVGLCQLDTGTVEQQTRLRLVHGQIVGADLHDRAPRAEAGQRDRRHAPGGDGELDARGNVDRELGECVTALVVVEELRVVDDQCYGVDHARQGGGNAASDGRGHGRARRRPRP